MLNGSVQDVGGKRAVGAGLSGLPSQIRSHAQILGHSGMTIGCWAEGGCENFFLKSRRERRSRSRGAAGLNLQAISLAVTVTVRELSEPARSGCSVPCEYPMAVRRNR